MKKFKRSMALFLGLIFAVSGLFAKTTPVENLHQYTLDNGLTLFVAENHSVPLTYIEIAVKSGAVDQTPENTGLFHLYEHMMFKGNDLYPNAASIQNALSEMGVASWNGTTGKVYVNYFITVPSSQTEKGLAFWNAAIRTPLMDPKEFENEKKVVISEISGYAVNPGNIYQNYLSNTMFPETAYRNDPAGAVSTVQNATVAQLRDIQRKFYIPSNAALFVGGDVDPEKTYQLVKAIYGTWSNN
ncbi:MAG: insulinase family protein, partial [Treponema sp.]|nr:insulinase family protein [Treponema sp.]